MQIANKNQLEEYSTAERAIGTWTDGKTLYSKTYVGTTSSISSTESTINVGVKPTGSSIKKMNGLINYSVGTDTGCCGIPYYRATGNSVNCAEYSNDLFIYVAGSHFSNSEYNLTIEYTY